MAAARDFYLWTPPDEAVTSTAEAGDSIGYDGFLDVVAERYPDRAVNTVMPPLDETGTFSAWVTRRLDPWTREGGAGNTLGVVDQYSGAVLYDGTRDWRRPSDARAGGESDVSTTTPYSTSAPLEPFAGTRMSGVSAALVASALGCVFAYMVVPVVLPVAGLMGTFTFPVVAALLAVGTGLSGRAFVRAFRRDSAAMTMVSSVLLSLNLLAIAAHLG